MVVLYFPTEIVERNIYYARVLTISEHFVICVFTGSTSLLQTKIPKSYIDVEKAVTKISEELNRKNNMPVLDAQSFR